MFTGNAICMLAGTPTRAERAIAMIVAKLIASQRAAELVSTARATVPELTARVMAGPLLALPGFAGEHDRIAA